MTFHKFHETKVFTKSGRFQSLWVELRQSLLQETEYKETWANSGHHGSGGAFNAIDSTRDAVRHGCPTSLGLLMHLQFGTTCWKQSWKESCHYSSPTQIQSDVFFLCVLLNIPQASITSVFRPAANQTKGTVQIDAPSACLRDVATGTALVCAAKENLKTNVSRKQTKKTKTS